MATFDIYLFIVVQLLVDNVDPLGLPSIVASSVSASRERTMVIPQTTYTIPGLTQGDYV